MRWAVRCESLSTSHEKADLKQAGMIDMTGEADGTIDRPEIILWTGYKQDEKSYKSR